MASTFPPPNTNRYEEDIYWAQTDDTVDIHFQLNGKFSLDDIQTRGELQQLK